MYSPNIKFNVWNATYERTKAGKLTKTMHATDETATERKQLSDHKVGSGNFYQRDLLASMQIDRAVVRSDYRKTRLKACFEPGKLRSRD
ncbi:MAG: hypothetical protein CMM01_02735 [Rhodopirellula sp.]|nr:hypothetical protein [Rhodopirellula sp.]